MRRSSYLFTSESVSEGHPDKVCDRISDAVVDAYLAAEPEARVACETLATTNRVVIAGEVRGPASITSERVIELARDAIKDIGYEQEGFHWKTADVSVYLHAQSAHIAQGVDSAGNKDEGAGDQGIMFGYACNETPELMPAPIYYAHKILEDLNIARKAKANGAAVLGPDAKSQVTVRYENGKPVAATQIVLSTQHLDENLTSEGVREIVEPYIRKTLPQGWISPETIWHVNPTGKFVIGGPDGDCGLTGRKIIVDTYGGAAPHGGGAFSGKDPTKVDRSAAYAARYLAKNVVAAGLADRCTLQLSYAIGVAKPLSIYVDLHDTGKVSEEQLEATLMDAMDLSPRGIRTHLGLNKPIYARTSAYGHFGRTAGCGWRLLVGADRSRRHAQGRSLARQPDVRPSGVRPRRRLFRAPERQAPARLARPAGPDAAAALRVPLGDAPGGDLRGPRLAPTRGSKSALAAASIWPPRRGPIRQINFIGCEPFVNGMAKLLAPHRAGQARQHPHLGRGRHGSAADPARCVSRPGLHSLSRPVAEAPPAQAPPRLRRHAAGAGPRHAPGRRAAFCQRHRQLHRLGAGPRAALGRFSLDRTRSRRLAQALCGLARHPLRGQGDPRGPRAELSAGCPRFSRMVRV